MGMLLQHHRCDMAPFSGDSTTSGWLGGNKNNPGKYEQDLSNRLLEIECKRKAEEDQQKQAMEYRKNKCNAALQMSDHMGT